MEKLRDRLLQAIADEPELPDAIRAWVAAALREVWPGLTVKPDGSGWWDVTLGDFDMWQCSVSGDGSESVRCATLDDPGGDYCYPAALVAALRERIGGGR